jgi:serine/threonine protein kinase
MTLSPGTSVGPYTIVGTLGSGGMGDVYRARDTRLGRTVAIKVLKDDLSANPEYTQRLEREARAIAGLSHPNICVLYDVGVIGESRYLVMELLDGETLAERLRRGPLSEGDALSCARDIAKALTVAHSQGVVHRDLKPGNVMLTSAGAKLMDFGLATSAPAETSASSSLPVTQSAPLTARWQIVGTPAYMSPERLQGRPSDARADIFAFGVVLYEMLAGVRPFRGESHAQIVAAVLAADPEPIAGVSANTERVVRRCLLKEPGDRWARIADVADALSVADGIPPRSPRHGSRWFAIAAAALIAGALAYTSFATPFWRQPQPVVVLMDSTLRERVYDPVTRENGGTNADDISDTLRDLSLEVHKETTSAIWRREEQIVRQHPALVIMHLSSFARATNDPDEPLQKDAEERTRAFLGFVGLANTRTQFIVYTRGFAAETERDAWVDETVQRFPALRGRLRMLHIAGDERATFRDPATRVAVKHEVESILGHAR